MAHGDEDFTENCPFCGAPVPEEAFAEHVKSCPTLQRNRTSVKRQIAVVPGQVPYEEGELPEHLKEVIRRKGSFLTDAMREVE